MGTDIRLSGGRLAAFLGVVANFLSLERFMVNPSSFKMFCVYFGALFNDGNARHRQTMQYHRWECPTIIAIAAAYLIRCGRDRGR
jgi:hypothetical protein